MITALVTLGISQDNAICSNSISDKVTSITAQEEPKKVKLKVTGITCAGCSSNIYNTLKTVDGVLDHSVEYPGDLAIITYNPAKTNPEALIKIIEKIGYKAEVFKETQKKKSE